MVALRVTKIGEQVLGAGESSLLVSKIGTQVLCNSSPTHQIVSKIAVQVLCNVPRTEIVQPIVFVT